MVDEAQVMVWAKPGEPLKQTNWERVGFPSLKAYIQSILDEGDANLKYLKPGRRQTVKNLKICTFGTFNPRTGEKQVLAECVTLDDLPTEDIEGVLEFNAE